MNEQVDRRERTNNNVHEISVNNSGMRLLDRSK